MNKYKICILPGEGIGPEVTKEAVKVLKALLLNLNLHMEILAMKHFKKQEKGFQKIQ